MSFEMVDLGNRVVAADVAVSVLKSHSGVVTLRLSVAAAKRFGVRAGGRVNVGVDVEARQVLVVEDRNGQRPWVVSRKDGKVTGRATVEIPRRGVFEEFFPQVMRMTGVRVVELAPGRLVFCVPKAAAVKGGGA